MPFARVVTLDRDLVIDPNGYRFHTRENDITIRTCTDDELADDHRELEAKGAVTLTADTKFEIGSYRLIIPRLRYAITR